MKWAFVGLISTTLLAGCATFDTSTRVLEAEAPADDCGVARSRDEHQSNPEIEACAVNGDPRAQAYLGMLYLSASASKHGDAGSYGLDAALTSIELQAEGRRLVESAARNGNAEAQNELGLAYLEGSWGYEIDTEAALSWLISGAENGDSIAPYNLARMYFAGRGVWQSATDGERYLRLSADRGYKPGQCSLARWLERSSDRRSRAEARALRAASAANDYGLDCATHDYMDEMPPIDGI